MIKRVEKQLQWFMQKGINMESWDDLQDNAWTNNTSKLVHHTTNAVCVFVCVRAVCVGGRVHQGRTSKIGG